TGSLDIMEGEAGFGRAMGDNPDWERALAGLGREFHITRMTFKNHACCGHTFAAIDGALALKQKLNLKVEEIERIDVGTYRAGVAITARGRREELLQPTRKGDPDLPLTDAELEDKYMELAAPVLGGAKAKALLARLWQLECA